MEKKLIVRFIVLVCAVIILTGSLQYLRLHPLHAIMPIVGKAAQDVDTLPPASSGMDKGNLNIYIVDGASDLSQGVSDNLQRTLSYAKVPFEVIQPNAISSLEPTPYSILVLSGEEAHRWPLKDVEQFVADGGKLFIGARFYDEQWNELAGIEELHGFHNDVSGLKFEKNLFPGYVDINENDETFSHSLLDVELKSDADIYLTASGFPVLWNRPYGDGEVMYWNTTVTDDKLSRGLLLQSMSLLTPAFAMNQAAIKILYLDDFPAPIPDGVPVNVSEEEREMDVKDFYTEVWWKDLLKFQKNYDVDYTAVVIGDYRDNTQIRDKELLRNNKYSMLYFGRNLLNTGGEIGLHGFNHQSLVTADEPVDPAFGYKPWKDKAEMKIAINRMEDFVAHYFPELRLTTYVPPSNVLNETGLAALSESMPQLKTVAALYYGDVEEGSFIQEFEFDDKYPSIYHFPRVSDGYSDLRDQQFQMVDTIANFGVFSHFIHPDDVLDKERSGYQSWETMAEKLEDNLKYVHEQYGYLESLTQDEATDKLIQYQESDINVHYGKDSIQISGTGMLDPSHVLIRLEDGKSLKTGNEKFGSVSHFDEETNLYLVTLTKSSAELEIRGE